MKLLLKGPYVIMIVSITLLLYLLGIIVFISLNSTRAIQFIKSNYIITVFLKDSLDENLLKQKIEYYAHHPFIKQITYIPADSALADFKKEIGEDVLSLLDQNPLPPSLEIHVKPAFATSQHMSDLKALLEKDEIVASVFLQEKAIDEIEKNSKYIEYFFYTLFLIVAFIVIGIIYNSIRLLIYSKRFIIRTMLLIGATRSFIYRPYLLLSLWLSLIAAFFSAFFLQGTFSFLLHQFPDLQLIYHPTDFFIIFAVVLGGGVFISFMSTYFSLRHYIRLNVDQLHT